MNYFSIINLVLLIYYFQWMVCLLVVLADGLVHSGQVLALPS
jgi:hypothetical protein